MPKDTPARRAAREADRARRLALVPPPPPPREPSAPGIWRARVDGQEVILKVVALHFVSGHRAGLRGLARLFFVRAGCRPNQIGYLVSVGAEPAPEGFGAPHAWSRDQLKTISAMVQQHRQEKA